MLGTSEVSNDGRTRARSITLDGAPIKICGMELTNQILLRVAACSFFLFVLAEIVGAFASNSLSLLGDAAAMSVDVFTYFCNMYSEHVKAKYGTVDHTTRMVLEVGIPSFSVTALIAVSAWITVDAVAVIISPSDSDDVNVYFLFGFAAGNMLIDLLCAWLFYLRRGDVLHASSLGDSLVENQHSESGQIEASDGSKGGSGGRKVNLNMASALTHVGGDTMRTAAVFIAAVLASVTDLDSTLCDAWAAVVVTITILFLVGPLLKEIAKAYSRLSNEMVSSGIKDEQSRNSTF